MSALAATSRRMNQLLAEAYIIQLQTENLRLQKKIHHLEDCVEAGLVRSGSPNWDVVRRLGIDRIDEAYYAVFRTKFPWKTHARAGLEFFTNPDTGEPDWTQRRLISRLFVAEHNTPPPWTTWEKHYK